MPKKPFKRGIKVLGDSANGYFSKFKVYTGKEKESEQGLGEHVVKTLTKGLEHKHHHVFFDNFFTSASYSRTFTRMGYMDVVLSERTERAYLQS